ncbi:MAG: dihydroxyacetone kinase phosphoryl donor subunit DhaM [Bacillota bacterium]
MVGIVIVSHSSKVAEGVRDLCQQMAQDPINIIAAGGLEDGGLGTDMQKILNALQEADDGDGVVILGDLGSAIMSSELAIDFVDEEKKHHILIADAPLIEGAIAAAVQSSIGGSLEEVKQAAEECRHARKL